MKINMPKDAAAIIKKLQDAGFEAYIVGGCVRDSLLGKKPSDWDITTSAKPEEVKSLFSVTIDTGIKHGTVTVLKNHVGYEVTTFRLDGNYSDGRHPDKVEFTPSLEEDLKRRDFTINAMAYNDKVGLVDKFGGKNDLSDNVIRCVGEPTERFSEDALRMMRAVRFSAQLGFEIDNGTYNAIKKLAPNITKVSEERIAVELNKIVLSEEPMRIIYLYYLGLLKYIIPELADLYDRDEESTFGCIHAMENTKDKFGEKMLLSERFAFLFYHFGSEASRSILKRLKYDNDTINNVARLIELYHLPYESSETEIRQTMHKAGELMPVLDEARNSFFFLGEEDDVEGLVKCHVMYEKIQKRGDAVSISQLKITGNDLIELGIPKGKLIGDTLNYLLDEVIAHPYLNNKQQLTKLAIKKSEDYNEKL